MLGSVVSKAISQTMELLENTIHSLVPGSSDSLHPLIRSVESIRRVAPPVSVRIRTVGKEHLIRSQGISQTITADRQIRPVPRRIRTIDPNNPARLDAETDLVSKTGVLELMAVPLLAERRWLVDFEISAIDSDKAERPNVAPVSELPLDLSSNKEALVRTEPIESNRHDRRSIDRLTKSKSQRASTPYHTHFLNVFRVLPTMPASTSSLE